MSERKVLGDSQKSEETRQFMQMLGQCLDELLNGTDSKDKPKNGFALLVFPYDKPNVSNYMSNCSRADMICAMKEAVARFEGQPLIETDTKQ